MKVAIVTSVRNGNASRCLPELMRSNCAVAGVIVTAGAPSSRLAHWKRKALKTWRIGLLGAVNGMRIRSWFADPHAEDIVDVCRRLNVPVVQTARTNSEETRAALRWWNVDLGLSLGNPYIGKKLFGIPRLGMINVHEELLPAFQGAQSILWPIYENVCETGFTIHQIDDQIDTGPILHQRRFPIEFFPTLRETVEQNLCRCRSLIPAALTEVCSNFETVQQECQIQPRGRSYTTPSFWQFLRMQRHNAQFWRQQQRREYGCEVSVVRG